MTKKTEDCLKKPPKRNSVLKRKPFSENMNSNITLRSVSHRKNIKTSNTAAGMSSTSPQKQNKNKCLNTNRENNNITLRSASRHRYVKNTNTAIDIKSKPQQKQIKKKSLNTNRQNDNNITLRSASRDRNVKTANITVDVISTPQLRRNNKKCLKTSHEKNDINTNKSVLKQNVEKKSMKTNTKGNRRVKKILNYADNVSFDTSNKNISKVKYTESCPIYKQPLPDIMDHKPNDIYEFDLKEHRHKSLNEHNNYDPEMDSIMKTILRAEQKKELRKKAVLKKNVKAAKGIKQTEQKLAPKKVVMKDDNVNTENYDKQQKDVQKSDINADVNNITPKTQKDNLSINKNAAKELQKEGSLDIIADEDDMGHDVHTEWDDPLTTNVIYNNHDATENEINREIETSFGFDTSPVIKIHSNVMIRPTTLRPIMSTSSTSTLNETFINASMDNSKPSRLEGITFRTPSQLFIKRNNLPVYNQTPVLDFNLAKSVEMKDVKNVEKDTLKRHDEKDTLKRHDEKVPAQKNRKQSSILDFVNSSYNLNLPENDENQINCSLFVAGDLSPIKLNNRSSSGYRSPLKEINVMVGSTPVVRRADIMNNSLFGFNESNEVLKPIISKPARFDYKEIKNVLLPKKKKKEVQVQEEEVVQNVPPPEDINVAESNEIVGIFEDVEPIKVNTTTKVYKKKRRRGYSFNDRTEDEDREEKPKKKKVNQRTKAEIMAENEWAAALNATFEEIDKYELEIE